MGTPTPTWATPTFTMYEEGGRLWGKPGMQHLVSLTVKREKCFKEERVVSLSLESSLDLGKRRSLITL